MDEASKESGTRAKILIAAATMLGENPTARLSVRAVAARAQVSTGSLRHFFPTQRELIDTVVAAMYDVELPDDPINEHSLTVEERLIACLQLILRQVGVGESARKQWGALYEAYVATAPSEDEAATYIALDRMGRHRISQWLTALIDEGAIPGGRVEERARFLSTVLAGLMTERALPSDAVGIDAEMASLRLAVHAVMSEWPVAR
ncbi:TetR/AcrR family transcriptional regulator [Microbacterium aurugineum]|uniref:TetR/AcrR family transcriptional regulator n=1 Tax=Microbacterium aurugineum TaxID=2851642 RepID=A0ABY4IZ05_9MICO|nr:helix-turn-helix domain-containing protein [Microbacterium aurugineum]UPL16688.1 TetR/AcrR family transcriptional regulator [Microbacterium aurugineum]